MPAKSLQPIVRTALRAASVITVALGLAGCVKGAETTGSIDTTVATTSPDALRRMSDTLGARFEANPNDVRVGIQYAQVLRALGQNAQAVAVLQQSAIRNPQDRPVLAAYGKALADAGRYKEAAEVLSRANRPERPDWRIFSVQGTVADQLGDVATAQAYYDAALAIVPGEPSVLSNKGLSLALAKHLVEAETLLRQAAADPRADARVRQNLALVLGLAGKFAEADVVLRRDLSPTEAAQSIASMKRMVSQPNSWRMLRQSDKSNVPPVNG